MSSTETKEGRLSLFFEPDITAQSNQSNLQSQVQQIIAQRGAFRNINEESLRHEIAQPKVSAIGSEDVMQIDGDEDEGDESDEETAQARQQKLWKSRDEMLQKLSYAQNEVLSALDFVSLLLSNHSKAAQASMSPALTAVVQPGTLDARVGENKVMSTKTKSHLNKVSEGWKSHSFGLVATKLGKAATRLTAETEGQGKYWEQIAQLKSHGWAISRLPADSRAIGVHFGFPESASQFRARGFVLLQQDEKGNLEFDSRLPPKQTQPIRFTVERNGIETGSFLTSSILNTGTDMNSQLVRARDSLFEEELFYEINREARMIANQNVQTQAKAVEVFISKEYSIKISQSGSRQHDESTGPDTRLARFVGLSARFLLTAEHTRLHTRRSQPPAPMSLNPPSVPEYAILRPIITQLRHQDSIVQLLEVCNLLLDPFKCADIAFDIKVDQTSLILPTRHTADVDTLREPARSSITLNLASTKSLVLHLETFLGSPTYGTVYRNSAIAYSLTEVQPTEMHDLDGMRAFLEHVLGLELVANMVEVAGEQSDDGIKWTLAQSSSREVSINKGIQKLAVAVATVAASKLTVNIAPTGKTNSKRNMFIWRKDGCWSSSREGQTSTRSLRDVIIATNTSLQS